MGSSPISRTKSKSPETAMVSGLFFVIPMFLMVFDLVKYF